MRKPEDILKDFDEGYPKFKWFIVKYFRNSTIEIIEDLRKQEKVGDLICMLNDIWFLLPDGEFNIRANPPGWSEFLRVIEE
jgi:hypothetical protein